MVAAVAVPDDLDVAGLDRLIQYDRVAPPDLKRIGEFVIGNSKRNPTVVVQV